MSELAGTGARHLETNALRNDLPGVSAVLGGARPAMLGADLNVTG